MKLTQYIRGIKRAVLLGMGFGPFFAFSQSPEGSVTGNFQSVIQYSRENPTIGALTVPEEVMNNSFLNVLFDKGNVHAGIRLEYYNPPILGIDPNYRGGGIPYRFVQFQKDNFDITLGNFYDQFGSGIIFRSYEERDLGFDNAMDGLRVKYSPMTGVYLKGIFGTQRVIWRYTETYTRALDGEFSLNEVFQFDSSLPYINLGASFVSRFEANDNAELNLPENVGAYSLRLSTRYKRFLLESEYVRKGSDPSNLNGLRLSNGEAFLVTSAYSTKGFGATVTAKHLYNMDYRSERNATGQDALLSFNPALARSNTWALATFYPYNTNNYGEMGFTADINYKVDKDVPVVGGTYINMNYSKVFPVAETITDSVMLADSSYLISDSRSSWFQSTKDSRGNNDLMFREFYIEATKKLDKKNKLTLAYMNTLHNTTLLQSGIPTSREDETRDNNKIINAKALISEFKHKLTSRKNIRFEVQHLWSNQANLRSNGNWAQALIEYNTRHYFVALQNMWNYESIDQSHYPTITAGYRTGATQIRATYGRLREGIFCVGGICRVVPASDGLTLTISSTF